MYFLTKKVKEIELWEREKKRRYDSIWLNVGVRKRYFESVNWSWDLQSIKTETTKPEEEPCWEHGFPCQDPESELILFVWLLFESLSLALTAASPSQTFCGRGKTCPQIFWYFFICIGREGRNLDLLSLNLCSMAAWLIIYDRSEC